MKLTHHEQTPSPEHAFAQYIRIIGKLENIDNFLPETPFSPLALLKREGKKRKRASPEREIVQATIAENDEW